MTYSTQRAVSDGSMVLLNISIDYFDRTEIAVLFDGIVDARQWAWVGTTDKQLSFTPAVANGVEVMVQRSTDISTPRHEFTKGAAFTAESLDDDLRQVLHIAQEATEGSLGGEFFTDIDMHGLQITNLGAATAPDHAVTLAQYQADASGASAAKDTAVASASTAVAASNSASASASAALLSANNADVSEFNALSSANSASASASTASTKATEAAASAAAALVSENAAELAESNAKASEVAAAASAAAALHPWEAETGGIHYDLGNVRIGVIGVASPTSVIQATAGNNAIRYAWYQEGVAEMWIGQKANVGALCFGSGSGTTGELMRIDTSGRISIGGGGGGANSKLEITNDRAVNAYSQVWNTYNGGAHESSLTLSHDGATTHFGNLQNKSLAFGTANTPRLMIDGTTGAVLAVSPLGGLGYGPGAGGTVTQATSKSTAVTLNKPTGQITTNNAALVAGASVQFAVNNSLCSSLDSVALTLSGGIASMLSYNVWAYSFAGGFNIAIRNVDASPRSEAIVINFDVIKGATS